VHRLGLSGRAKSASAGAPRQRKSRSPALLRIGRAAIRGNTALAHAYEIEVEAEPELIDNIIPIGQRRTIMELTESTCRWPVGDPGGGDFFFCGGNTISRRPNGAATGGRRAEATFFRSFPRKRESSCSKKLGPRFPGDELTFAQLALPNRSSSE